MSGLIETLFPINRPNTRSKTYYGLLQVHAQQQACTTSHRQLLLLLTTTYWISFTVRTNRSGISSEIRFSILLLIN